MKKLVLKKEVVARINNEQMNQMRGGFHPYIDTFGTCQTMPGAQATCTAAQTCSPNIGCGNASEPCFPEIGYTEIHTMYCNDGGGITQDICGLSHMVSQCDTCFVRCAG